MGQVRVEGKVETPEGRVAVVVGLLKKHLQSISEQKCPVLKTSDVTF